MNLGKSIHPVKIFQSLCKLSQKNGLMLIYVVCWEGRVITDYPK